MHRFKKFIIHTSYLIIFLIIHTSYFITHTCYGAGESALVILEEPIGARPVGMGGAFTAVADDINALYYNPAGLSFLTRPELSTMYLKGLVDSYYGFAGFVLPFKKSALALSMTTFDGGSMDINTLNSDGSFKESKTVKAEKDQIPMLSYSFVIGPALSFGLNLKMVQSTLVEDYPATAYAADVGLLIRPINDSFCLGFVTKNIGTPIKYKNLEHPLPMSYKAGVAIKPADWLTLSGDYEKPDVLGSGPGYSQADWLGRGLNNAKLNPRFNLGLELSIMRLLFLRAGFRGGKSGDEQNALYAGFGLGAGGFLLDYSFAGIGKNLDKMHRMSFTMTFGSLTNYRRGEGYRKKEMYERAIYWLSKVSEKDGNYSKAKESIAEARKQITSRHYYDKGQEYFNEEQYVQAIEEWKKVVELIPKYRDTEEKLTLAKSRLEESEANISIGKAKETIKEAESIGLDMKKAKLLFSEAGDLFNKKEYLSAKAKAEEAYQLATSALGKKKEEPKPAEKPKVVGKKMNIAVAELEAHEVSAMEAATVADFLRTELINSQVFVVLERSNMAKVLAEQRFQQTGCTTTECAVQMGKILNVQSMLVGSFSKALNAYYINARLVDVESGAALVAETVSFTTADDLYSKVKELADKIIARISQ
jgi:tetratricopeptide (TPR) repeat protein